MRLLIVCPTFPDESDRYIGGQFIKEQLRYLSRRVESVSVVCPITFTMGHTEQDKTCHDYSFDNVRVFFPRYLKIPIRPLDRFVGLIQSRVIASTIRQEKVEFDIVHAHFTWPSGHAAMYLKKKLKKPIFLTIHENREWLEGELNSKSRYFGDTWKKMNLLIRVNNGDLAALRKYNQGVIYLPNGYDHEKYRRYDMQSAREKLDLEANPKIIFSLGSLIKRKGYRDLILAMKDVVKFDPMILCFIGGDGPEKAELEMLIQENHLTKNVALLGFVPDERINDWLNACDLYVQPSLSESFGIVQLEAMAVGKPVVATRNGGSEEVVISEEYGAICEPGSPSSLSAALIKAIGKEWDDQLIRAYATTMTWEKLSNRMIQLYKIATQT